MLVIVGLILLGAAIGGAVSLLSNAGTAHQTTETFSIFGHHVTGTATLLLFWIAVGAVAAIGLGLLFAGVHRTVSRGRTARRQLARSRRETAFLNRDCANPFEQYGGAANTGRTGEAAVPADSGR